MAKAASAIWGAVKTVQTVSPKTIEEEVYAPFRVALVGAPEDRARLKEAFLTDKATVLEREDAEAHLREFDEAPDADTTRAFAFTVYCPAPGEAIGARGENSVPLTGVSPEKMAAAMLEARPRLSVALARRFPLFRAPACERIIRETSKVNAGIAIASALPGVLPFLAPFLPGIAVADTILLTKNQVVMIMRLAAIYGQRPAYTRQIKELVGTIGAALGWRTVARELVGFVPAGVGVALKGSIAFSGTMAAGRAALFYYQTGRKPTKEAIQAAYKESEAEAKQAAQEVKDSLIASANAAAATTEQAVDTEDIMAPAVVPAATPSAGAADKPEPPVNDPA